MWERAAIATLCSVALAVSGCEQRAPVAREPYALPVDVYADTGRGRPLAVVPPAEPAARVWLERVSQARIRPAPAVTLPEPDAAPETLASEPAPPAALAVDDDLKPPLLRERGSLTVPAGARRDAVELDVRVDEEGRVSDALWAAGSEDSALVHAATACALGMRFYPALQAGRPVAVWCRQRFEFGR